MGRASKNWDMGHVTMVCTGAIGLLSTWEEDLRAGTSRGVKALVYYLHPPWKGLLRLLQPYVWSLQCNSTEI